MNQEKHKTLVGKCSSGKQRRWEYNTMDLMDIDYEDQNSV
jgi:hypothetical protein